MSRKKRSKKTEKSNRNKFPQWLVVIPVAVIALLYFLSTLTGNEDTSRTLKNTLENVTEVIKQDKSEEKNSQEIDYPLPSDKYNIETDYPKSRKYPLQIIKHKTYALGYYEPYEQPLWVQYTLEDWQVKNKKVDRERDFYEDPAVKTRTATPWDYAGPKFDRGHLVPSADRRYSKEAQREVFYMSNISPQYHKFNAGIWNALEIQTRKWAIKEKKLLVITAPVFGENPQYTGKKNKIAVPSHFYKIIIDLTPPYKAIAFLIPHTNKEEHNYFRYKTTIDNIENLTGLDFLPHLPDSLENYLESRTFFWKK